MPDVGSISGNLINFTPFFPIELYNGFNKNSTDYANIKNCVSTFEFFDKITIGKKNFIRFIFYLSSGNINGNNYNLDCGSSIVSNIRQTIILNESLINFLTEYSFYEKKDETSFNPTLYYRINSEESKKISNLSFILMIPYLLWCIYALTLNANLYILN